MSEHRCVWGMAGRPVMVRLPDKGNTWSEVQRLVPDMLAAGILGYPFICPDMIGGGSWVAYLPGSKTPYDKELFIRSAQVHALCPMMQFSVHWIMEKAREFQKNIYFSFIDYAKAFDCLDHNKLWKILHDRVDSGPPDSSVHGIS